MTVLRYDRLDDTTLVATASHDGRSVAAIIHPRSAADRVYHWRRWVLAGDGIDPATRPEGTCTGMGSSRDACAEAAQAVADHLGIIVDGYEVAR